MANDVIDELQLKLNANASNAIRNLNNLQTSLAKTARSINSFSSATRKLSNFSGKINTTGISKTTVRLQALGQAGKTAMDGIEKAFKKAGSAVKNATTSMLGQFGLLRSSAKSTSLAVMSIKTALATLVGVKGITGAFNWLKESISLGADITEIDHIVESVFTKNMVGYVHEWASSAISEFGIAEASAKKYAGTLSSMFQASQVGTDTAGKMAMDLVGLAGDLSAFYNIDTETAYNKIRSGMAGMVRPLRDLGIDLTAATLEEYRLAKGIETSYRQMSQAEKVMLRYNYLMDNTKTQQGDFARTNQSLANSMRTLKAYVQSVSTQIGVGLASALRHVIVWLNEMMKYVLAAAQSFATFMQTIFGKYKGGASGIAMEGLGDSEDYMEDLADGADATASGLSDADEAAKQLKKDLSVLPFDELNQLNKDRETTSSDDGSGGAGAGGLGVGDLMSDLVDYDELAAGSKLPDAINDWAKRIKTAFKAHNWEKLGEELAWGINKGIDKLYDLFDPENVKKKVLPWVDAITRTFNSLVDKVDWDKLGRTIGRGLNNIVSIADRFITGIDWKNLGKKLAQGANGLVDELDFKALGKLIGDKFMIAWNTLYGFVHEFDFKKLGKQIGNALNGLNEAIDWKTVANAISTGFNGVFDSIREIATTVDWGAIAKNITDGLNEAIHNTNWAKNGESLGMFINNLCDTLISIIDNTDWEGFGRGLALALQKIPWGKMLKVVGEAIITAFGGVLRGLASTPAGEFATAIINGIIAFKIGTKLLPFVNKIGVAITGNKAFNIIGVAVNKLMSGGFASVTGTALGATAAFGGFLVGVVKLAEGMNKLSDAARGGNGELTEMGRVADDIAIRLASSYAITGKQADALFELKEKAEDAGMFASEFGRQYVSALQDMGVPASTINKILLELYGTTTVVGEGFEGISDATKGASDTLKVAAGDIDMSSATAAEGFDKIRNAIFELYNTNLDEKYQILLEEFDRTAISTETAQEAYNVLKGSAEALGIGMEDLNATLREDYPEATAQVQLANEELKVSLTSMGEVVETTMTDISSIIAQRLGEIASQHTEKWDAIKWQTQHAAETQASQLEQWQNTVSEFRESVVTNLGQIGQGWGDIDFEQEQTLESLNANLESSIAAQETTLKNMEALNSKNLDDATVQAILKQIDPSSEAMNDLVEHMEADDQTWQDFQNNIKENLDMTKSIEEVADGMATEFAKATAPEFVKMGADFKVQGGEIGKFMITGVGAGIYGNTKEAISSLKTLSSNMKNQLNSDWQINSPSKVMEEKGKYMDEGLAQGIRDNITMINSAVSQMGENIKRSMDLQARGAINMFVEGINSGRSNVYSVMSSIRSDVESALRGIDLYSVGQTIGESLADGIRSIHIPTPYMYISGWDLHDLGDGGYMYTPDFSTGWYRSGGLFMGGKGTMIGIAEDNRDEAVLPLEDHRAMARIGSAIAEAGGTGGSNMAKEIAYELAQVLMTNSDERPINLYAELKTEDSEVLARTVIKGLQSMDYRNNPTPALSF